MGTYGSHDPDDWEAWDNAQWEKEVRKYKALAKRVMIHIRDCAENGEHESIKWTAKLLGVK